MSTYFAKPGDVERSWRIVDAEGKVLGRLATRVADVLRGKDKPQYTPHTDTGDFVVVINAGKVVLTGNKLDGKLYYSHSGYPGSIKGIPARRMIERKPDEVIFKAVKGMLPKNRLNRKILTKLKVYSGSEHPHQAQEPKVLDI